MKGDCRQSFPKERARHCTGRAFLIRPCRGILEAVMKVIADHNLAGKALMKSLC